MKTAKIQEENRSSVQFVMYGSLGSLGSRVYGSLGTRVYASLFTMCIYGRVTFKINGYFVLVARSCCLLKHSSLFS